VKLLVDMNLAPAWVDFLTERGFEAVHWSTVGDPRAFDQAIAAWASAHDHAVLTADLDFGAILAFSGASGPSVVLVRAQDTLPSSAGDIVARELSAHRSSILSGAVVTVDRPGRPGRIGFAAWKVRGSVDSGDAGAAEALSRAHPLSSGQSAPRRCRA
jgi:predicted nuclease of predicted toxin-antitoxin system